MITKKLTPLKAIRQECLDCSGNQPESVLNCQIKDCYLFPYRMGNHPDNQQLDELEIDSNKFSNINTPLKCIRKYCLGCCNNQPKEVKSCTCVTCPFYKYRTGKNPNRAGIGNVNNIKVEQI